MGLKYGLPAYFAGYASSIWSLIPLLTDSKTTSFVIPGGTNATGLLRQSRLIPTRLLTVVAADV